MVVTRVTRTRKREGPTARGMPGEQQLDRLADAKTCERTYQNVSIRETLRSIMSALGISIE